MPAGTEAGGAMPGPTAGAQVAATPWRAGEKRLATTRAVNAAATTACFIRLQYRSVRGSVAAGQAASGTNGLPGGTKNGVAAARPTAMRDAPGMATSHDRGADPSEPRRSPLLRELVLAAALFLLADAAVAATQPLIDVADGKGWDGASYYTVAQQLASGERPTEEAPFVYRLGTPFLAATIAPNDLIAGFVALNAAANALTAMLFFLWLRPFIPDLRIRLALLAAFVLMWHGPIHFFHFYPVSAEHLTYAINLLGLFGAYALRERISVRLVGALAFLAVGGAAVRETALLAVCAVLGWIGGQDTERYVFWAAPVVFVLIGRAVPDILAIGSRSLVALLLAAQVIAERAGLPIPQPLELDPTVLDRDRSSNFLVLFTPLGDHVDYFDLWSFWMPRSAKVIALSEYVILLALTAGIAVRAAR